MAGQPMKYTVTHYRKPEHTHEAFIKWITDEHLPVALPIFKKHGILSYFNFIIQCVTPAALNGALKEEMGKLRPSWDFADLDCFLKYTIPDVQAIKSVMSDPAWQEAIRDQEEWVDTSRALVSLGYHTPYLPEAGEVVNMPKENLD